MKKEFKYKTIVKKIVQLSKNDAFTKTIDYYKSIDKKLKEKGVDDYEIKIKIENNKLILDSKSTIKSFVDCTDNNYVISIITENDDNVYISASKRKAKRKSTESYS